MNVRNRAAASLSAAAGESYDDIVGSLRDLVHPADVPVVTRALLRAVAMSFHSDAVLIPPTRSEVRRRGAMCIRALRTMRGDLGWSVTRSVDHLPKVLRAELDGVDFDYDRQRGAWSPSSLSTTHR